MRWADNLVASDSMLSLVLDLSVSGLFSLTIILRMSCGRHLVFGKVSRTKGKLGRVFHSCMAKTKRTMSMDGEGAGRRM